MENVQAAGSTTTSTNESDLLTSAKSKDEPIFMFTLSDELSKQQNSLESSPDLEGSSSTSSVVAAQPGVLAKQVDQLFGSNFDTETLFEEGLDPLYDDIQRPSFKTDFTFNETVEANDEDQIVTGQIQTTTEP